MLSQFVYSIIVLQSNGPTIVHFLANQIINFGFPKLSGIFPLILYSWQSEVDSDLSLSTSGEVAFNDFVSYQKKKNL